jgi:hypothetical protein
LRRVAFLRGEGESNAMIPADFSRVNDRTIQAKQQLLDRLDELEIGASEADLFNIARQRTSIQADLDMQKILQQRLLAASVTVTPLSPAEQANLNTLAALVEQAIVTDSIVAANLALVTQIAASAKGIGAILQDHTS